MLCLEAFRESRNQAVARPQTPRSANGDVEPPSQSEGSGPGHSQSPSADCSSRRRQREDEDDLSTQGGSSLALTPRSQKRFKFDARSKCRHEGLDEDDIEEFTATPSIAYMLLDIKINLLKAAEEKRKSEAEITLASTEFKQTLSGRLLMCLLSPSLSAYVTDLLEHVMDMMKRHPTLFKIPLLALEDNELYAKLRTDTADTLTGHRSSIKQKITASLDSKEHVSALAKSLAPVGAEIGLGHWNRVAFLRRCVVDFEKELQKQAVASVSGNVASNNRARSERSQSHGTEDNENEEGETVEVPTGSWTKQKFWPYVDFTLRTLYNMHKDLGQTEREQDINTFFTRTLSEDLQAYKKGTKRKEALTAHPWQDTIRDSLVW